MYDIYIRFKDNNIKLFDYIFYFFIVMFSFTFKFKRIMIQCQMISCFHKLYFCNPNIRKLENNSTELK